MFCFSGLAKREAVRRVSTRWLTPARKSSWTQFSVSDYILINKSNIRLKNRAPIVCIERWGGNPDWLFHCCSSSCCHMQVADLFNLYVQWTHVYVHIHMGIKLITITTLVHSGGNADIGNKLAELLMPELDEKVIILTTVWFWWFWLQKQLMTTTTRLTPQWWPLWWRPAASSRPGRTQRRSLSSSSSSSSSSRSFVQAGGERMKKSLFVFFMEGPGSGLCYLFLFIEVVPCHTKQPSSSWIGHSRPEKSVNLNSSKLRTLPPLTDLVFLFQHPMAR